MLFRSAYEAVTGKFKAANATDIFNDFHYYTSKAVGSLKAGDAVETLGKVKDYDWFLIGKNGEGIGYVPRSLLMPAS